MASSDTATATKHVETKEEAEALIPQFKLDRVLNQDQNGRRMTLLGTIRDLPALLTLERAAFPTKYEVVTSLLRELSHTTNLGANDVYRWYMAGVNPLTSSSRAAVVGSDAIQSASKLEQQPLAAPDLKLNLIYPCTPQHIKKYTSQKLRYVTESPTVYASHVKPWVERTQRTPARLDWIYNILDGITEQEDVIYRTPDDFDDPFSRSPTTSTERKGGFILLPDLNWDRKTVDGLHLLALVQRRDLWSLRGLKKSDLEWLRAVRNLAVSKAASYGKQLAQKHGGDPIDEDMLKCYVHYQPTYYHFHIHVVHVMLEPEGTTQSVGKAFSLENLISQLQHLSAPEGQDDGDAGLYQLDLSYFVGEENDLWKKCFSKIKQAQPVDLNE